MLRLIHTSDWHLGRQLHGRSLIEDQEFALERLIELLDQVKPHALLIAGDVFDRPLPPESAVRCLDRFLTETTGVRGLPVFMIPGNHDSCERLGFASGLLRDRGVTIFSSISDSFRPVKITGDDGTAALIYGIPFVEPIQIAQALGQPTAKGFETPDLAITALCRALLAKKPADLKSILLCHAFVAGAETSESEKEIFIGGSSLVDSRAFDGFTYTALGHLHKAQKAGRENVRYSGSLLPYSKSEITSAKAILEVRIGSTLEVVPHHLRQKHQLRYIEGELAELLQKAKTDPAPDDMIIAAYTDRGAVLEAFAKLHAFYPNLLHVSRLDKFLSETQPALARSRARESLSELDLFAEFFRSSTGSDLNETERTALIESIQELERTEANP